MRQVVTLGDLAGRLERLAIRCRRGERPALIRLTRPLEAPAPGWRWPSSAFGGRRTAPSSSDRPVAPALRLLSGLGARAVSQATPSGTTHGKG
jgi:hypothetical protein